MKIKTETSLKEYIKLLFRLIYKRIIMKIIVVVGFLMLLCITGYYLHFLPVPEPEIYQYITLGIIAIGQPSAIFWLLRRNYMSSNLLSEKLEVEVTTEKISIIGKSFYSELNWKYIFKVEEVNDYILIYRNTLSAVLISERDLTKEEIQELKAILKSIPNVPMNFKEKN